MTNCGIYVRVSTKDQTVENQLRILKEVAKSRGWSEIQLYEDEGISGSKGEDSRPGFKALCDDIRAGKIDVVATWAPDRLSRSLQDMVKFLQLLDQTQVDLYLHTCGIDTTTPGGRAMFQMMGVFAEFERGILSERVKAGMSRAKAQGKRIGKLPTVLNIQVENVLDLRSQGLSLRDIEQITGLGHGTVQRICNGQRQSIAG